MPIVLSRHAASLTVALAFSAFAFLPAGAQQTSTRMNGLALSSDKLIQIESDELQIFDKEKRAEFNGNVVVVQGTTTIRSGGMTVFYKSDSGGASNSSPADIDHIIMTKKVLLTSENQKASGDTATFDMNTEILTLEGESVVLTEDDNIFKGCKLTVQMPTGEALLEACGGRVQIQLDPKSKKN